MWVSKKLDLGWHIFQWTKNPILEFLEAWIMGLEFVEDYWRNYHSFTRDQSFCQQCMGKDYSSSGKFGENFETDAMITDYSEVSIVRNFADRELGILTDFWSLLSSFVYCGELTFVVEKNLTLDDSSKSGRSNRNFWMERPTVRRFC